MESGAIPDAKIIASSEFDSRVTAVMGRLNLQATVTKHGCWAAYISDVNQWLQVDLGTQYTRVTRVATQGRNSSLHHQWVTGYKLQYSNDELTFQYYREQGQTTYKVNSYSGGGQTYVACAIPAKTATAFKRTASVQFPPKLPQRSNAQQVCNSRQNCHSVQMYSTFGHYLTHAHSQITRAVATNDSCSFLGRLPFLIQSLHVIESRCKTLTYNFTSYCFRNLLETQTATLLYHMI